MARSIPEDIIKRVQATANIVDIIGESVVLKKAGRNYQGLCPFHAEKTPSFSVSPEKQIFFCFGCRTGGSVFNFLMQHEGISFPEAVRKVAARYSIEVPEQRLTPVQKKRLNEKEQLYQINDVARAYFSRILYDKRQGQKAMAYLMSRGMTRTIIDDFQLGYAPQGWDGLLNHFRQRRLSRERVAQSGLIVPRKSGNGFYDRFRNRVMFPIFNVSHQIVGFGGRVMGDDLPKYLNSPETPIYNKRQSLYGIHKARQPARSEGKAFVVEGYFDVLALHLYGIQNAVATLGTALTTEHAKQLKGLVGDGEVILVFDSDQAGIKAAHRSIAVFEAEALDARILVLPQDEDPDSYLRSHGPDEFLGLASGALSFIPFLINWAVEQYGLSLEGKVKIVGSLQDSLAAVKDNVARALYVRELAERLDIAEAAIAEKIQQVRGTVTSVSGQTQKEKPAGLESHQRLELQLVAMMIRFPSIIDSIVGQHYLDAFESERIKNIARTVIDKSSSGDYGIADLVSHIDDDDSYYRNLVAEMAMADTQWDRHDCDRLLKQFENRKMRQDSADLQRQIEAAEHKGDYELLANLLRRKQIQAKRGMIH